MAIQPYQQKIGVPNGAGITSQNVPQLGDVGDNLTRLAGTVLSSMEPRLKKQATDQAVADFGHLGLGKDEQGNYTMPETPEGGLAYVAAFDQAKRSQYVLAVQNDTELELNRLYSDPANMGMTPRQRLDKATEMVNGKLANVDPEVAQPLFETLTREVRQRDLQANNAWLREEKDRIEKGHQAAIASEVNRAQDAYTMGDGAVGDEHRAKARALTQELVDLRLIPPEAIASFDQQLDSVRGAGVLMNGIRAGLGAGKYTSDDLSLISSMLDPFGAEPEGASILIDGKEYSGKDIRTLVPDQTIRNQLNTTIGRRAADLFQQEQQEAKDSLTQDLLDNLPDGSGAAFNLLSPEKQNEAAVTWASQNGLDLMSTEGVMQVYRRFGGLPSKFYEANFANAHMKTEAEVEALRPIYETMANMPDRNGGNTNIIDAGLKPADSAFLLNYTAARGGGSKPTEALQAARQMRERGESFGRNPDELRSYLREQLGAKDNKTLWESLDDKTPGDWDKIPMRAREAIELDVAQQVVMGANPAKAVETAAARFKNAWTQDRYSVEAGRASASNGESWVRKTDAVPVIYNINNSREANTDWVVPYANAYIHDKLGEQVPGVPEAGKLVFGQNVWARSTGRKTASGDQMFMLVYYDPKLRNPEIALQHKDGGLMIANLGRAAQYQNTFAREYYNLRRASQLEGDRILSTLRGSPGYGEGMDSKFPIRGVQHRGPDPQAQARYREWQARHADQFGDDKGPQINVYGSGAIAVKRNLPPMAPLDLKWMEPPAVERNVGAGQRGFSGIDMSFNEQRYTQKMGRAESSGNPNARNPNSSATGLFGFTNGTWIDFYRKAFPNTSLSESQILSARSNVETQHKVLGAFNAFNQRILRNLDVPVTDGNMYLMHFLGNEDGPKVLRAPVNAPIRAVITAEAVAANERGLLRGVRTVGDFFRVVSRKMGGSFTGDN